MPPGSFSYFVVRNDNFQIVNVPSITKFYFVCQQKSNNFFELKLYFLLYFIKKKLFSSHVNNADVLLRFSH